MSNISLFVQTAINSLVAASEIILVGISFGLTYRTARFIHFAQALTIAAGAYFAFFLYSKCTISLLPSMGLSVILCAGLGAISELSVHRPLRNNGSSGAVMLLASLGVLIVGQNIISLGFGDDLQTLAELNIRPGILLLGARLSPIRLWIIVASLISVVLISLLLNSTKIGKQMRAVGNSPFLSDVCGVNSNAIILITFGISSALAGLAGALLALDTGMTPTMGINPLILGIVAVIIAGDGAGNTMSIVFAGLIIGTVQQLSVWFLGSEWNETTTFLLLLVVLLLKPTGLFGQSEAVLFSKRRG
jgi:branched-subunit amino acid ABC-type transport system permease component